MASGLSLPVCVVAHKQVPETVRGAVGGCRPCTTLNKDIQACMDSEVVNEKMIMKNVSRVFVQTTNVPLNTTFFTAVLPPHKEGSITRLSPDREKHGGNVPEDAWAVTLAA